MKIAVVLYFAVVMICASGGKKIGMSFHLVVIAASANSFQLSDF